MGAQMDSSPSTLTEKIQSLDADQIVEVERFVEFIRLHSHDGGLTRSASSMSAPAFEAVWNNPEDAAYDAL
jgi:hypothetical protein